MFFLRLALITALLGPSAWAGVVPLNDCELSVAGRNLQLTPAWSGIDPSKEYNRFAYTKTNGQTFYYLEKLSPFDQGYRAKPAGEVELPEYAPTIGTNRKYDEYLKRLDLDDAWIRGHRGAVLSVGEGESNFTAEMYMRGWDAWSVDAAVKNSHLPERSVLARAQRLPFQSESFDLTVSVWMIPHFFRGSTGTSMFNPTAGRLAVLEMLRVTKIGGEVRINPIMVTCQPVIDFLRMLQDRGLIEFEVVVRTPELHLYNDYVRVRRLK